MNFLYQIAVLAAAVFLTWKLRSTDDKNRMQFLLVQSDNQLKKIGKQKEEISKLESTIKTLEYVAEERAIKIEQMERL